MAKMNDSRPSLYDLKPTSDPLGVSRLLGLDKSFNPQYGHHLQQLQQIQSGIMSGTYGDDEIRSFVQNNPAAAPLVNDALQRRDIYRKNFQPAREAVSGFEDQMEKFQGEQTPPAEIELAPEQKEVSNYKGAIVELLRAGKVDEANNLIKAGMPGGRGQEFTYTVDNQGRVLKLPLRRDVGEAEELTVAGKPVIPAKHSPVLQAAISQGRSSGKEAGKEDVDQHQNAISALGAMKKNRDLLAHLKTSTAITGMGAEFFNNVERAKAKFLGMKASGKTASDTELLDAMMGAEVFPLIKSLGIGARGLDTPAERDFLRRVMTGTIPLNKDTLVRMTELRNKYLQQAVDRWNDRVRKGELDRYFRNTGRRKEILGSGSQSPPQNNGTEDWVSRAIEQNPGMNRQQIIQEGIRRGKVPRGYR